MQRISSISPDLKKQILELLYSDEIYNSILIELIEGDTSKLGELYLNKSQTGIADILHIKNDGNSDLTNFMYTSKSGLEDIASTIKDSGYNKILLAGKLEDVKGVLGLLGYEKEVTPNIFYRLNPKSQSKINVEFKTQIRLAEPSGEDLETVKQFTAQFLEVETEDEFKAVTNNEKILAKIKSGIYLLEYKNNLIGMARFIGKTKNFAEITSVYIHEKYRGSGFGKELICHMIDVALKENKTPVLATSILNIPAMKTYESMGFEIHGECAFEFLD